MPGSGAPAETGQGAGHGGERTREPGLDDRPLFRVERVAVGRADRLHDGALDPGVFLEPDVAQVGVVDVAGEDRDRGRWPCRASPSPPLRAARAGARTRTGRTPSGRSRPPGAASRCPARRAPPLPVAEPLVPGLQVMEAGREQVGHRGADQQVVEVAAAVVDDPLPDLVVEDRAPLLGQDPGRAGVHEDRPHPVDVAAEAPADAGRGGVDFLGPLAQDARSRRGCRGPCA